MRRCYLSFGVVWTVATFLSFPVFAQEAPVEPEQLELEAPIEAVTLYLGRAAVTRRATVNLSAGIYELAFPDLPASVQPDSLQARATGDVKVVSVDFSVAQRTEATSPEAAALDAKIEDLRRALAHIDQDRSLIAAQEEMLKQLGFRVTSDASNKSGSEELNMDKVKQQLDFVAAERVRLLGERQKLDDAERDRREELRIAEAERAALGAGTKESRSAIVTAAAPTSGDVTIELVYLVSNATWHPSYNIRAAGDLSGASVEYDAVLVQQTGEDWKNVALTLSTAQPRLAANPPTLDPWYVDVATPQPAGRAYEGVAASAPPPPASARGAGAGMESKAIEQFASDASVTGSGPAVAFEIPRKVTVLTNAQKQQRTRIGSFQASASFVYVAVPIYTEAVYLRGDLVNSSAYQLLPGPVAIFLGQDYVGPTSLTSVPPNGKFEVHFGIDPAITAKRLLVEKNTERTGLFSGGRKTQYSYRISIDNGTGKAIKLELWDRVPASRSDQIQVDVTNLSVALATDAKYVNEDRPRGLLKWLLSVPASATGANAARITYGVEINRAKDVTMTPLPE